MSIYADKCKFMFSPPPVGTTTTMACSLDSSFHVAKQCFGISLGGGLLGFPMSDQTDPRLLLSIIIFFDVCRVRSASLLKSFLVGSAEGGSASRQCSGEWTTTALAWLIGCSASTLRPEQFLHFTRAKGHQPLRREGVPCVRPRRERGLDVRNHNSSASLEPEKSANYFKTKKVKLQAETARDIPCSYPCSN